MKSSKKAAAQADKYPAPLAERHGNKVSWYYYSDELTAKLAAGRARREARELAAQGYDFGYLAPGDVRAPNSPRHQCKEFLHLFEVVIP